MREFKGEYLAARAAYVGIRNCLVAEAISSPKPFDDVHPTLAGCYKVAALNAANKPRLGTAA